MELDFPSKRRGSLVISVAILKAARTGVRQKVLIRSVSLTHGQLARYIALLRSRGLIMENKTFYQTTEKGKELIKEFESSQLIQSVLAV